MDRPYMTLSVVAALALAVGAGSAAIGDISSLQQCPAGTFNDFAAEFLNERSVQQAFTRNTVVKTQLVDATPEPRKVTTIISARDAVEFLDPARRRQEGLTNVKVQTNPEPRITLSKPDTDFQLTYTFVRTDCWFLSQVDDESL